MVAKRKRARGKVVQGKAPHTRLSLLERLFCNVTKSRRAPSESGVKFTISAPRSREGICLLFNSDNKDNPIVDEGKRPDYVALHLSRDGCIVTIIEMKGRTQKGSADSIDQIVTLRDLLVQEARRRLPGSCSKIHIQGIVVCPPNSQVHSKKLNETHERQRLLILPIQHHHAPNLYPYISRRLTKLSEGYKHSAPPPNDRSENINSVEELLLCPRDRHRMEHLASGRATDDESVLFSCRTAESHIDIAASPKHATIRYPPQVREAVESVKEKLEDWGLSCSRLHFQELEGDLVPQP